MLANIKPILTSIICRYGEVRTSSFTVIVKSFYKQLNSSLSHGSSSPSSSSLPSHFLLLPSTEVTTDAPDAAADTSTVQYEDADNDTSTLTTSSPSYVWTTPLSIENTPEYKRQFFLLKMFVLGGIGSVFAVLAVLFWIYFMYLWRTWDANKREHLTAADLEDPLGLGAERNVERGGDGGSPGDDAEDEDPMMNAALLNSRRKSVSFTVARLGGGGDPGSLVIDFSTRSVPIASPCHGGGGGGAGGSAGSGGSRSGSRTGSSCTMAGATVGAGGTSPTPSAPSAVALGDWRRSSLDVPSAPRRLSLAPEDALLHHSYSLYSPSASAARAKFLRRESEGSAR